MGIHARNEPIVPSLKSRETPPNRIGTDKDMNE